MRFTDKPEEVCGCDESIKRSKLIENATNKSDYKGECVGRIREISSISRRQKSVGLPTR